MRLSFTLVAASLLSAAVFPQSPQAILSSKCVVCHGNTQMSGLDLRTRDSLLRGGERGPAVVPGKAADSLLFQAIRGQGNLKMPPGKSSLTSAEIETLQQWINAGAPFDTKAKVEATWWSFRKPVRLPAPTGSANPIDTFIAAKLKEKGLTEAPEADGRTLVRRAYFDLHGLPPTPEQAGGFLNDTSPDAYAKLIDKLLESPRYGERWGRYWLDLVRYADTSGFETDHFFVSGWRYRDYVIESFNTDKRYDTFLQEQVAADEIWSTSTDLEGTSKLPKEKEINLKRRIGTALFTIGSFPIEYTYYGDQFRAEWQAEAVDTIGSAFLGLTVGCARCHDHKFDPITHRDYYKMTAMFSGSTEREIPLGSLFDVQSSTRSFPLLAHAEAMKRMARGTRSRGSARGGAGPPPTPTAEGEAPPPTKPAEMDSARAAMLQNLGEAYLRTPERPQTAHVLGHDESVPPTHVLVKGDWKNKGEKVEPGFPAALPGPKIDEPTNYEFIPKRRKALALWLTDAEHPLVARVMVNRIWQGHFGEGLVRTPNDFGRQGEPPTHPELLDWLATEFIQQGWSLKKVHRLIMLSQTYRASSFAGAESLRKDPENLYLSRMNRRRLDGDALRDTVLATAGALNLRMGGVGIIPPLTKEEILAARMPELWPANPDPAEHNRRSIYLQMKRSLTLPLLQIFDAPDSATSCARRERSTVAPQALAMMNSEFSNTQAKGFAERIRKQTGSDPAASVNAAWQIALARPPREDERATARDFLQRHSLERLCLLLFNMSEFLYAD